MLRVLSSRQNQGKASIYAEKDRNGEVLTLADPALRARENDLPWCQVLRGKLQPLLTRRGIIRYRWNRSSITPQPVAKPTYRRLPTIRPPDFLKLFSRG